MDGLIDLIWGSDPSSSAVNQLHRLVGQARRLFEPDLASRAPGRWVQPAGHGYRLVTDARTCDLTAVHELTVQARAAAGGGRVRAAAQAYAQALELAQEPVFAGLDAEILDQPTDEADRAQITASPLRATTEDLAGLPQALVIVAEADVLRDEGEAYAAKLRTAGVDVTAVRYQGIIHDFVLLNALKDTHAARAATRQGGDFLRTALHP